MSLNHPGIVQMAGLVQLHVWPTLDTDIQQLVRSCEIGQTSYVKVPITSDNPWIWPHHPCQRVHISPSIKFTGTHLYTWVERGTVRVMSMVLTISPPRPPQPLYYNSKSLVCCLCFIMIVLFFTYYLLLIFIQLLQ